MWHATYKGPARHLPLSPCWKPELCLVGLLGTLKTWPVAGRAHPDILLCSVFILFKRCLWKSMGCVHSFLSPSGIPRYSCVTVWWLVSCTGSVGPSLQLPSFWVGPFQHSWADFCGKQDFLASLRWCTGLEVLWPMGAGKFLSWFLFGFFYSAELAEWVKRFWGQTVPQPVLPERQRSEVTAMGTIRRDWCWHHGEPFA